MNRHKPELISALIDRQLKGVRRLLVLRHARSCPVCAAEYRRQLHVRQMLAANPPVVQMSDSPEFFWSKVKREIERRTVKPVEAPKLSLADWLRQNRLALGTVAAAILAAIAVLWTIQARPPAAVASKTVARPESPQISVAKAPPPKPSEPVPEETYVQTEQAPTGLGKTVVTAFDSDEGEATVIWVSGLPWTPDMTEMKTLFANL
jgi:anti-sigma factor RsiW